MNHYCKALNKTFTNKENLFNELKKNKDEIIAAKKAEIIKSYKKGIAIDAKPLIDLKLINQEKAIIIDEEYYYIAVSSSRILDSHEDMHLDKMWNRSIKNQQGKNYLVDTHELSLKTTIVRKEHIEMFAATIPFSAIGKNYSGDTEVLVYKFRKDKVKDQDIKEWLDSGDEVQASVRMQYVDIVLAINSDSMDDKKEKANYDAYYPFIANKDDFENEIMYFWAVKEAKNIMESSLVPFGSNHSTGKITGKNNGSSKDTHKDNIDSLKDTRQEELRKFYLNN